MTVEIINRFNGGNGGASIVITQASGSPLADPDDEDMMSEFVSSSRAREIALDLLRNATTSTTFEAIKKLLDDEAAPRRLVLPVKEKP